MKHSKLDLALRKVASTQPMGMQNIGGVMKQTPMKTPAMFDNRGTAPRAPQAPVAPKPTPIVSSPNAAGGVTAFSQYGSGSSSVSPAISPEQRERMSSPAFSSAMAEKGFKAYGQNSWQGPDGSIHGRGSRTAMETLAGLPTQAPAAPVPSFTPAKLPEITPQAPVLALNTQAPTPGLNLDPAGSPGAKPTTPAPQAAPAVAAPAATQAPAQGAGDKLLSRIDRNVLPAPFTPRTTDPRALTLAKGYANLATLLPRAWAGNAAANLRDATSGTVGVGKWLTSAPVAPTPNTQIAQQKPAPMAPASMSQDISAPSNPASTGAAPATPTPVGATNAPTTPVSATGVAPVAKPLTGYRPMQPFGKLARYMHAHPSGNVKIAALMRSLGLAGKYVGGSALKGVAARAGKGAVGVERLAKKKLFNPKHLEALTGLGRQGEQMAGAASTKLRMTAPKLLAGLNAGMSAPQYIGKGFKKLQPHLPGLTVGAVAAGVPAYATGMQQGGQYGAEIGAARTAEGIASAWENAGLLRRGGAALMPGQFRRSIMEQLPPEVLARLGQSQLN